MNNYSEKQQKEFENYYKKICDIKKGIDNGTYLKLNPADRTDSIIKVIEDVCEYFLNVPGNIRDNHEIDIKKMLEKLVQVKKEL